MDMYCFCQGQKELKYCVANEECQKGQEKESYSME